MQTAVSIAGNKSRLGRKINVTHTAINKWVKRGWPPAERCLAIERATGGKVTRYDLRPDVFGPAPDHQEAA